MTTKKFLSENRQEIINFYNNEIKIFWNISLKDFITDLMKNFRKITISDGLKKMDLMGNLSEAKSRLGLFDVKITSINKKRKENIFLSESSKRQLPSSMR